MFWLVWSEVNHFCIETFITENVSEIQPVYFPAKYGQQFLLFQSRFQTFVLVASLNKFFFWHPVLSPLPSSVTLVTDPLFDIFLIQSALKLKKKKSKIKFE